MTIFTDAIHTEKHTLPNGKVLVGVIEYDTDATNPREWDNLGTILIAPNKSHWVAGADDTVDMTVDKGDSPYEHWENIRREQLKLLKSEIAFAYPITKYEHGNIRLSLGYKSGWDCGVIGFVYATKEQVRKCYGVNRLTKTIIERAENCVQSELDTLSDYLNGNCYGYRIYEVSYDELGDIAEYNELDSCWDYVGDIDYCLSELQNAIKNILKHEAQANTL